MSSPEPVAVNQTQTEPQNAELTVSQTPKDQPGLHQIESQILTPDNLSSAQTVLKSVLDNCHADNVEPVWGFNPNDQFPEGYSLAIEPISKRGEGTVGCLITQIPTFETLSKATGGMDWISKQINNIMLALAKKSASKPAEDFTSVPITVSDFINAGRSAGLSTFNQLASTYVTTLRQKSPARLDFLNAKILRKVLSSAAFADETFVGIPQTVWTTVLNAMIAHAGKLGLDAGILTHWLNTRDTVTIETKDIDLSDLNELQNSELK